MTALRIATIALALTTFVSAQPRPAREVCVTVDDLPFISYPRETPAGAERYTRKLLAGFAAHKIPAIGFVNEGKLQRGTRAEAGWTRILRMWHDAGLELGNHTYSHPDLHVIPVDAYLKEIVSGEPVTTRVTGKRPRYFRHPFLHTGRSIEVKNTVEDFLAKRGYRVAPITIDNYDYIFAKAYDLATAAERPRIAKAYVDYMTAVVAFYEQQSVAIVGREVRQTLLIHASALNADTIDDLARMFTARGYTFVSLDRALEDPAYRMPDTYTGAAGLTWLHRWAITAGMSGKTFAGEPTVPEWIDRASKK
jgi:peptidoglycan/xylan/chitin deacetylase (PgdA/CDA1 family)